MPTQRVGISAQPTNLRAPVDGVLAMDGLKSVLTGVQTCLLLGGGTTRGRPRVWEDSECLNACCPHLSAST
jgi:hypothetical protein